MPEKNSFKQNLCIILALAGFTLLLYWPATGFDFTNFDDPDYVYLNPFVNKGLSWHGIVWAFQSNWASNWHPLTWISHMMDCSLFGLKPGGHHAVNLLLHALNSVVVFLALQRLTSSRWRSALVAGLFAWHPLHVESVAWIAERKDLLSALFWFLAIWSYSVYAQGFRKSSPKTGGKSGHVPLYRNSAYIGTLALTGCGLLSKPMVVTLPCVFMLLDIWPLRRISLWKEAATTSSPEDDSNIAKITLPEWILEKIPFIGLCMLDSLATFWAQKDSHAMVNTASLPIAFRMANSIRSYLTYLGKLFWPTNLSVHYPYSHDWSAMQILGASLLLAAITGTAFFLRQKKPFLIVGWLWFLGSLVPVIGLVQVGAQALADRYMYIPATGIFIMLAWSLPAAWFVWPRPGMIAAALTGSLLFACMTLTEMQLNHWQNSITLFAHAVEAHRDDMLSEYNLGEALTRANYWEQAIPIYERVLNMQPNRVEAQSDCRPEAHFNLGLIYRAQKKWKLAEEQFRAFISLRPELPVGHSNLGAVLVAQNRPQDGTAELRMAYSRNNRNNAELELLVLSEVDSAYGEAEMFDKALSAAEQTRQRAVTFGNKSINDSVQQRIDTYKKALTGKK